MEVSFFSWIALVGALVIMGAADFFLLSRRGETVSLRRAGVWTAVWTVIGLGFTPIVWVGGGGAPAAEYFAGYLIERSLSIDNLFVFALIFGYFSIPAYRQDRLLMWGIAGALVLRAMFIVAGAAALHTFHWTIYVFGALLIYAAIHMARQDEVSVHPERNPLVRMAGGNPAAAALAAIMTADVVFAVDSIPAIFAITTDTFIVFAANAFSLLGMRPLYFLLADALGRFGYLKYGLAAVLGFVGVKMLLSELVDIPIWLSLVIILVLLGTSVGASMHEARRSGRRPAKGAAR
jgi:tellurite resistance protein TerC